MKERSDIMISYMKQLPFSRVSKGCAIIVSSNELPDVYYFRSSFTIYHHINSVSCHALILAVYSGCCQVHVYLNGNDLDDGKNAL